MEQLDGLRDLVGVDLCDLDLTASKIADLFLDLCAS